MRKYSFFFSNGKAREFAAEMDTIKEGAVILSKKKEQTGMIVRTDTQPAIVAVVSLSGLDFYEYKE